MFLGICIRVSWICLLFILGNCLPVDHKDDNTTSLSPAELLTILDSELESEVLPMDDEPSLEAFGEAAELLSTQEGVNLTSDLNSTMPDGLSPKGFHLGIFKNKKKEPGSSEQMPQVPHPGHFEVPSGPWYGPSYFHETPYAGAGSHPYSYGSGSMGYPYYGYSAIHGPPPYGYDTPGSPHYGYAYGPGGGSPPYSYGAPGSPPFGYAPPGTPGYAPPGTPGSPPFGYAHGTGGPSHEAHGSRATGSWFQQHPIIDPELVLIGNILMRVRQMPLAQAWRTDDVPMTWVDKPPVYPVSLVVQSNSGYQRARDLHSDSKYSKGTSDRSPEPEIQPQQAVSPTSFQ